MSKKIVSLLLALTMTLCCCSALAENTKHERVYVVTKPDGTVENITAYWLRLAAFVVVFALLSMITLEFIDKDKR